jgi:hypothetical protein
VAVTLGSQSRSHIFWGCTDMGLPDVRVFTLPGDRKGMLTEEQRAGLCGSPGEISALDRRA